MGVGEDGAGVPGCSGGRRRCQGTPLPLPPPALRLLLLSPSAASAAASVHAAAAAGALALLRPALPLRLLMRIMPLWPRLRVLPPCPCCCCCWAAVAVLPFATAPASSSSPFHLLAAPSPPLCVLVAWASRPPLALAVVPSPPCPHRAFRAVPASSPPLRALVLPSFSLLPLPHSRVPLPSRRSPRLPLSPAWVGRGRGSRGQAVGGRSSGVGGVKQVCSAVQGGKATGWSGEAQRRGVEEGCRGGVQVCTGAHGGRVTRCQRRGDAGVQWHACASPYVLQGDPCRNLQSVVQGATPRKGLAPLELPGRYNRARHSPPLQETASYCMQRTHRLCRGTRVATGANFCPLRVQVSAHLLQAAPPPALALQKRELKLPPFMTTCSS